MKTPEFLLALGIVNLVLVLCALCALHRMHRFQSFTPGMMQWRMMQGQMMKQGRNMYYQRGGQPVRPMMNRQQVQRDDANDQSAPQGTTTVQTTLESTVGTGQ
jgi:hypothetical protein